MLDDIRAIEQAVERSRVEYNAKIDQKKYAFWKLPFIERQDLLRSISAELQASLDVIKPNVLSRDEVVRIAASYAYLSDMKSYNEINPYYMNRGTE